jgi:hypothetical protein
MSYDHYRSEYHLTMNGWIGEEVGYPTEDRAETWEKEVYQGSEFGRESEHWRKLRSSPNFTKEQCAELHERFPFPGKSPLTDDLFRNLR